MELKSGYKQTEIPLVPENWRLIPLGDFLHFRNGVNAPKEAYGRGTPFVNLLEVITYTHIHCSEIPGRVTLAKNIVASYSLRRGDLLFNRTSETQEEVGLTSVYADDEEAVFGGFVICGRPNAGILDAVFSGYAFRTPVVRRQITACGQGAIRANIGQADLRRVQALLPPPDEQQVIGAVLSDADALIGALDKLIAKKRDLKQAAMQQLLTGKRRLSGFAPAKFEFKQTEAGVIPEDWEMDALGELFSISGGFSASRAQLNNEGHCYLHYGDIHKSAKSFVDVGTEYPDIPKLNVPLMRVSSKSLLATGDVVFVDASEDDEGASKHVVVINDEKLPYISGLHTIVAKSTTTSLDNTYKRYCFQTRDIKRQFYYYAVGTKVTGISKTNIKKIFIPLPPIPEQRAIAAVLSDMDAEIAVLEQRRDKTRALKQGMMQELLTGKTRLI
jgi:type I restriction enzyme S subunit